MNRYIKRITRRLCNVTKLWAACLLAKDRAQLKKVLVDALAVVTAAEKVASAKEVKRDDKSDCVLEPPGN